MFLALTGTNLILTIVFSVLGGLILIFLFIFFILKNNSKKKAQALEKEVKQSATALYDKFGGKDNILEIKNSGSRVVVTLNDISKADKKEIQNIFESVLFMGNKIVFVIGSKSEEFKNILEDINKTK